jgi:quinol monooxygenase YgiN
MILLGAL